MSLSEKRAQRRKMLSQPAKRPAATNLYLRSKIGEGGSTLSGGEKQRISIARAILKDAPIVLLDEATASIDPDNEAYIQQAITEMVKGKTLVVIAHKLSAVMGADQILMIEDGQISARGTHSQLLESSPAYQELWEKQKKRLAR